MMLRPYQADIARSVIGSIEDHRGATFTVEIARQGGKTELSAHLEVLLLTMFMAAGGTAVKCSPTFRPQAVISMTRLKDRLNDFGFSGIWAAEMGYMVVLGAARQLFLSADKSSAVVGHTADILLEIDEAQDVSKEKYTRDFRPMGSAHNVTTVLYGTTWDDATLLEEMKQSNLELEKKDGMRRHFRYDWQAIARHNDDYRAFVEAERERLGESHPLFRTQYALLPVRSGGGFLSAEQRSLMKGTHPRQRSRRTGSAVCAAGIDLAGEAETEENALLTRPGRDSTVITFVEIIPHGERDGQPGINVVEHYCRTGMNHATLLPEITDLLKRWNCRRIAVDATGIGEPVASFLRQALGPRVMPFKFTQQTKSELGFSLLAAVNAGRLKIYRADGSEEYAALMAELEKARSLFRPNRTLNFYVDPCEGHDDFLMSLALAVHAAEDYTPKHATGSDPA